MYAIEFQATIENGIVRIPEKYRNLWQKRKVKFVMMYEADSIDERVDYESWNDDELLQLGKIGFNSKSFEDDDDEDYSKW